MKKTIRKIVPAMLVLVALTTLSFMAKDGVTLRLKPQQGKTYTLTSKANMMTMMEVQGQSMSMSQVMEFRQTFTPKEVSDNQSVIETQLEAIKMNVSQMGMKLEYDSEHPEKTSPMLAGQTQEMEKYLKKPTNITYDALGHVIDSIELEMNQLSAATIEFPEEELTVGSSWTFDKTQEISSTEMSTKMTYTVTAISKKSIDVEISGNIESTEASGTYTGTASINPQTGLIIQSSTKSNISMTLNEQGMSIPMTMVGTTTVEVK
jgi:predicted DNA binding CopG/RHH family protein